MSGTPLTTEKQPEQQAPPQALPVTIAPSLLSCDFARIGEEVAGIEAAGADWLHVDVMDGHFVPNLTIGPPVVKAIHGAARVPLDVHLMISEPVRYAADYARAGAHVLTFHLETTPSPAAVAEAIAAFRETGVPKVGVALNPDTPLDGLEGALGDLDLVLVMSVFPGFGGQSFIADVLPKVRRLRELGYRGHVEMDGGLNAETLPLCAEAGADCLVAGSAIFGAEDRPGTIREFRRLAQAARGA